MPDEVVNIIARRNHRRFILSLLLLMILVNLAVRYPIDHIAPMGSDTYFTLELGRSLAEEGTAKWVISPLSYFGLYPLSYPSGSSFEYAELHLLSGMDWNFVSLAFSLFFTMLFVLGGFMLFRAFRLRDDLSALLAGLMALSPLFLYFSYQQASGRGFLIPMFLIGLFVVVWPLKRSWSTPIMFFLLTFAAFAIHRSSMLIVLFEGMAGLFLALAPVVSRRSNMLRRIAFVGCILFGLSMVVWPSVPGLKEALGSVDVISSSFRTAEWEFRTGYFFNGDTLTVLLVNLATNYVGSIGIILLMMPLGFIALYPVSKESRERDLFLIACMLGFAPFVWRAQYIQLIILPFAYLLVGLTIQRSKRIKDVVAVPRKILFKHSTHHTKAWGKATYTAVVGFILVSSLAFSLLMFDHRLGISEPGTGEKNWPSDADHNLGVYLSTYDTPNKQFVSVSGVIDRRITWYSGWNSPITDPAALQASGYLNANASTFSPVNATGDYFEFITTFYNINQMYEINKTTTLDWTVYELSWGQIYGFFKLYQNHFNETLYRDGTYVNVSDARLTMVVESNVLGDNVANIYLGEGTIPSRFLAVVSNNDYVIYEDSEFSCFLAAFDLGG